MRHEDGEDMRDKARLGRPKYFEDVKTGRHLGLNQTWKTKKLID